MKSLQLLKPIQAGWKKFSGVHNIFGSVKEREREKEREGENCVSPLLVFSLLAVLFNNQIERQPGVRLAEPFFVLVFFISNR